MPGERSHGLDSLPEEAMDFDEKTEVLMQERLADSHQQEEVDFKPSEQEEEKEALKTKHKEEQEAYRKKEEYEYIRKRCGRNIRIDTDPSRDEIARIKELLPEGAVGQLYWPMRDIVAKLALSLEEGKFELLIGEDASGRIPALILKKVVDSIYDMSERPHPKMIFLAGASNLHDWEAEKQKMDAVVAHLRDAGIENMNIHNALIITDTLHTGRSVELLSWAFEKLNIPTEIASIAATKRQDWSNRYHIGGFRFEPNILHRSELSAVEKESSDVHAKGIRGARAYRRTGARREAKVVADMLMEWYSEIRKPIVLRHIKEVRAFESRQKPKNKSRKPKNIR